MKFCPIFNKTYRLTVYSLRPTKRQLGLYDVRFKDLINNIYTYDYVNIQTGSGWATTRDRKEKLDNRIENGVWVFDRSCEIELPETLFTLE